MKNEKERALINNWAYFYVYNIVNNGNPRYTIKYCARLSKCSIGTISRQIARIRLGYETDYDND